MILYVVIGLGSLAAALLCIYAFRLISNAGVQTIETVRHAGDSDGEPARFTHLNSNIASSRSPWGWGNNKHPAYAGKFSEARGAHHALPSQAEKLRGVERRSTPGSKVPWGWTGNESLNQRRVIDEINSSSTSGSVRNVLTGYDLAGNRQDSTTHAGMPTTGQTASTMKQTPKASVQQKPRQPVRRPTVRRKPGQVSKPWGW